MSINIKCPKCGSTHVQLSVEKDKHGCLWTVLFGIYYVVWLMMKWMIGALVFMFFDWWMAIIKKAQGKGYTWRSKGWFSAKKRVYYCHDCGYNFRA